MRELTKSVFSFSWALSLFGAKKAVDLIRPGQRAGGDAFTPITQATVSQLDESWRAVHRFGDQLQTRFVDLTFSWMNPENFTSFKNWNPFRKKDDCSPCAQQAAGGPQPVPGAPQPVTPDPPPTTPTGPPPTPDPGTP